MDRDRADKLISGLFDQAADDIDTDRLTAMKVEVEAQMRTAQTQGLYRKVLDALDTEISARSEGEEHPHPQMQSETQTAGGQSDKPGEMRHGGQREASMKWRVTGR